MSKPNRAASNRLTRREVLKGAVGVALGSAMPALAAGAQLSAAPSREGIIARENARPGTTDWQLPFIRSIKYRSRAT
jgi:hypothetical protein